MYATAESANTHWMTDRPGISCVVLKYRHPKNMVFYAGKVCMNTKMGVRSKPSNFRFVRIYTFSFSARTPPVMYAIWKGFHRVSNILCMNGCGNGSDIVTHVPSESTHQSRIVQTNGTISTFYCTYIRKILITMQTWCQVAYGFLSTDDHPERWSLILY